MSNGQKTISNQQSAIGNGPTTGGRASSRAAKNGQSAISNQQSAIGNSPDVCQCQCLIGEACGRKVCTGAYKLEHICGLNGGVCDQCVPPADAPCPNAKKPLPPCPFCGSHDVEVEQLKVFADVWWGCCNTCAADTDLFYTEAEAEAAWRRRDAKPEVTA